MTRLNKSAAALPVAVCTITLIGCSNSTSPSIMELPATLSP